MRASTVLALAALSVFAHPVLAARSRPFFQASRSLAMGDAYTAHDIGYEAVYYNPAGVARPAKPQVKFVDLEITASQGMIDLFSNTFSSFANMSKIVDNITKNPGKNQAIGLSLAPQFLVKNFSIGVLARTYGEGYLESLGGNLNFYGYSDLAAYSNFGVSLGGGIVKIGAGLKALNRAEVNKVYSPAEYAGGLSFSTQFQEGIGYGLDLGLLATWPRQFLPTLGIAVLDVGNTTLIDRRILFTGAGARPGAPAPLRQRVNVGFTLNPKHDRGLKSTLSIEAKDVLNIKSSSDVQDRFHMGFELNSNDFFFLRAGLNQGRYWTAGFGFQGGYASLEFATYGENVAFDGQTRVDDRKYVVRYVMGF